MKNITDNEMKFILTIFKNPKMKYNSSNLSKVLEISRMGCLKISKKLEKEDIIILKELGKAKFFSLNLSKEYVQNYISFLLKREAEQSTAYVKVWINELRNKITKASIIILFGSVLTKGREAKDIDVMFVTTQKNFEKLKEEIEEIKLISNKEIHPVYQLVDDLKNNLNKNDSVIINIIKGIVITGTEEFVELIKNEPNKE